MAAIDKFVLSSMLLSQTWLLVRVNADHGQGTPVMHAIARTETFAASKQCHLYRSGFSQVHEASDHLIVHAH